MTKSLGSLKPVFLWIYRDHVFYEDEGDFSSGR